MSNKNNQTKKQILQDKTSSKKAAVMGKEKKKGKAIYLTAFVCALLILAASVVFFSSKGESVSDVTLAQNVTYPVEMFNDGNAKHFELQTENGITVKYFVIKSSDGVIRAAFDACDVCWPSGKGYYQDGDSMVCRNCGRRFVSIKVNEIKGGCNPAPLKRRVEGSNLILEVNDIIEGGRYFDFSNGRDA